MSGEWDSNPRDSVSKTDEISQAPLPPETKLGAASQIRIDTKSLENSCATVNTMAAYNLLEGMLRIELNLRDSQSPVQNLKHFIPKLWCSHQDSNLDRALIRSEQLIRLPCLPLHHRSKIFLALPFGFEPKSTVLETVMLPLHHRSIIIYRTF